MGKSKVFIDKMSELLNSSENVNKGEEIFRELTTKKIYIYGAGNAGYKTLKLLEDRNIEVEGFFDRRGGNGLSYYDKPVYKAEEAEFSKRSGSQSVIIIAFICGYSELTEIQNWLLKSGWESIYYFQTIYYFFDGYNCLVDKGLGANDSVQKILETASLMEDEESFEVLEKFFKAIVYGNPDYFSLPSEQPQYFVNDIPFHKGYSRFIDCGAFDGDTAYALKKYKGEAEAVALFEPDNANFNKLCENLKAQRIAENQILFPCGVWKNSEMLRFRSGVQSSSVISDDGDTFIQCIAIDDVIGDFAPTFIKMDIEGAEYEALTGAEQTIRKHRPDLAISVYHSLEHIWEIPLLIKRIEPGYKFYLRSHDLHGMETILYAVSEI